jgi:hypothetical protein
MTLRVLSVAAAIALAACFDTPFEPTGTGIAAPGAAAVVSNTWRDVQLVIDKCDAPDVVITGGFHEVFWVNVDPTGALHRGYHLNFRLTGDGTDGLQYAYSGVQTSAIYFANPPFTDVTELRLRMIAQGSHDDFIQVFRYHQTINANGDVTTSLQVASEECGEGGSGGEVSP